MLFLYVIQKYRYRIMVNLLKILNIGDELYSPICGECKVIALDSDEVYCITVRTPYGGDFDFDRYGRFAVNGIPLLFITEKH